MRGRLLLLGAVVALAGAVVGCGGGGGSSAAAPTTGAAIYRANCATCHGATGQGFVGLRLAGVVAGRYPNVDDQIAVVTNGKGAMPAWGSRLSAEQIRTVVEYTRTKLGT